MMKLLSKFFVFLFFNKDEKALAQILDFPRYLILNFFVQRLFGINSNITYSVHYSSKITSVSGNIIVENNSPSILKSFALSGGCYIVAHPGTKIEIGEGTLWAYDVGIVTGNHGFIDRSAYVFGDVKIGKNCWLAKGVCVMPGITLGDNVTVGANSVVTKSFPSNVVIAGVPARIIKEISE